MNILAVCSIFLQYFMKALGVFKFHNKFNLKKKTNAVKRILLAVCSVDTILRKETGYMKDTSFY